MDGESFDVMLGGGENACGRIDAVREDIRDENWAVVMLSVGNVIDEWATALAASSIDVLPSAFNG